MRILPKPYFATLPTGACVMLAVMGLCFIFLRPPLLPEDLRFIGTLIHNVRVTNPGFLSWLQKVFWVMGGYMVATGLLTIFFAQTSFRNRLRWSFGIAVLAVSSSIGLMTVVNFMLGLDFKWVLSDLAALWAVTLILNHLNK